MVLVGKYRKSSEVLFSPCGLYRWWLTRELSNNKNEILFVGLNPSKASYSYEDPTLRRIISFCNSWGYGALKVVNLFARISCSPNLLSSCTDPIGRENDKHLRKCASHWSLNPFCDLWFAWGSKGILYDRDLAVISLFKDHFAKRKRLFPSSKGPLALGLTKYGQPLHPLYIPKNESLKPFILK